MAARRSPDGCPGKANGCFPLSETTRLSTPKPALAKGRLQNLVSGFVKSRRGLATIGEFQHRRRCRHVWVNGGSSSPIARFCARLANGAVKSCHGSQLGLEPRRGEVEEDMQLE